MNLGAPGPDFGTWDSTQQGLTSYLDRLAEAAGHADRAVPLKLYSTGLLLPGERKSVEPMAARLAPANLRRMHQSLHYVVADAVWNDEALLRCTRDNALAAMKKNGPLLAWIVDDSGLPKTGAGIKTDSGRSKPGSVRSGQLSGWVVPGRSGTAAAPMCNSAAIRSRASCPGSAHSPRRPASPTRLLRS